MIHEKLFLDKINDVFVNDASRLNQYQKDGLRSLYRQYGKKKPGYVVHDPYSTGCTQVAIFLNAIKHLLDGCILIICNDIENWKDAFRSWTNDTRDVLFNSAKLLSDKKIFVNILDEALAFGHREWSILVVDDAEFPAKLFRQLKGLKAGFKIVMTSVDLKTNHKTFSTIYEWIDPAEKVSLDRISRQLGEKNALDRLLLLDWYLQDKVLRSDVAGDISENAIEDRPKPTIKIPAKSAPKKNKDATGTKVKKSKPKPNHIEQNVFDTPSDSSRFEFDTMTDPHAHRTVSEDNKLHFSGSTEKEKKSTFETEIDTPKGAKRKRPRIIESDDESETDISAKSLSKETITECVNATNENKNNIGTENVNAMHGKVISDQVEGPKENSMNINEMDISSCKNVKDTSVQQQGVLNELKPETDSGSTEVPFENKKATEVPFENKSASSHKQNELMEVSRDKFSYVSVNEKVKEVKAKEDLNYEIKNNEVNSNEILIHDAMPVKTDANSKFNTSIFEDNMKALEEKTYNKFKGSVLDSLF